MKDEYVGVIMVIIGLALGIGGFFSWSEFFLVFTLISIMGVVVIIFRVEPNTQEALRQP